MKTRNLSLLEYLDVLQIEFFISEIRSRFYYNPVDKKYYKRVASQKKDKIQNICTQNNIKSIFNDENYYKNIKSKIYPDKGVPKFDMNQKDMINYYSTDSDVKCFSENDEIILGKIVSSTDKYSKILVKIKGSNEEMYFIQSNVTRIL